MYLEHLLTIERTETSDFLPIYNFYLHIHSSQLIISLNIPISSENLRNFGPDQAAWAGQYCPAQFTGNSCKKRPGEKNSGPNCPA